MKGAHRKETIMTFDLMIRGGTIVDGTGADGSIADLGIVGDRIHAIGDLSAAEARDEIDATGLTVAPGFVDVHNHAHNEMEGGILNIPDVENQVRQGVTTLIAGNCGGSPWPIGEHLDAVDALPIRQNYGLLVGMGTIRSRAEVGPEPATREQIARMQDLAARAMDEGAFGMSTGYFPEFVTTEEIAAVARPIAEAGGVYATHMRSEAGDLLKAVEETIRICEQSGCPGQISHIKCWGACAWEWADRTLEMIDEARARGLDLTADRYPYVASFSGVGNAIPTELRIEAGKRGGLMHLRDEDLIGAVREGAEQFIDEIGGPESMVFAPLEPMPEIDGRTLAAVADERDEEPWETALELTIRGRVSCMFFVMREENIRTFMRHPAVFAASDGHLRVLGKGVSHPRNYGTFPRWVGHYGRDEGLFTVEEVVRKCTSMPASKFGLHDRGTLAPRMIADIVVFDADLIIDRATFEDPHQYPAGIPHVIVAGNPAVRDGDVTPDSHGRALRLGT
ncbi:MAG: amidohydrolase family protein [Armatimonadia bacterium]|nr:amidohydrolase family protein [Armatimonadia bacterium]